MVLNYKPEDILSTAEAAVYDSSCLADPILKSFHFIDPNNPYAEWDVQYGKGTFCYSFAVKNDEQVKCLRVWKDDKIRLACLEHIKRVSDYFYKNNIEYVIGYTYIERAIRLKNGIFIPAILMDWVNGDTLIDYVKKYRNNPSKIRQLSNSFLSMCQYHDKNRMAHGDLSAGNIIVQPDGKICLIDYDSFYVPEFGPSIPEYTKGTPGYQHPERLKRTGKQYIDKNTDSYSQLVIYLSLLVIAEEPQLFNPLLDDIILFTKGDMQSRHSLLNSDVYKKVSKIQNNKIKFLLEELVEAIGEPLSKVRSITEIIATREKPKSIVYGARNDGQSQPRIETTSPAGTSSPNQTSLPNPNPTNPRPIPPVRTVQTGTPWYKKWYLWVGAAVLMAFLYFTFGQSDSNNNGTVVQTEMNVATAISRLEGNYTLREKNSDVSVNGIRTAAIKKTSESQARILVSTEYGPEFYDFTYSVNGSVESEQLGKGEITYNEKLDKITLTFKQGERICEFTK